MTEELDCQGIMERFFFFLLSRILLPQSPQPLGCRKELIIAVEGEMFYSFIHSTKMNK